MAPFTISELPDRSVGISPRRKAAPGQLHMDIDGNLLECFRHHLFPKSEHVEWRKTDKYGPPERVRLQLKLVEEL